MKSTYLEEKRPNPIKATYYFIKGLFQLIMKTFFAF